MQPPMHDAAQLLHATELIRWMDAHSAIRSGIPYREFIRMALYAPELGYYTRGDRARVGRARERDFYTAASLGGNVFGQLVAEAAARLLDDAASAATAEFVELGAEPGRGTLDAVPHPFAAARTIRVGEDLALIAAPTAAPRQLVVFSNELFDAQPFDRVVARGTRWAQRGVRLRDGRLEEFESFDLDFDFAPGATPPAPPHDGYCMDLPTGSVDLLERIASAPWSGVFIAFDYGLRWDVLAHERPQGTARTYRNHALGSDLLDLPGSTDITCHVCWDWLEQALARHGFRDIRLESQEAFLMHHAPDTIARIINDRAGTLSRERQSLKELLLPGNMGARFQVLHARRAAHTLSPRPEAPDAPSRHDI